MLCHILLPLKGTGSILTSQYPIRFGSHRSHTYGFFYTINKDKLFIYKKKKKLKREYVVNILSPHASFLNLIELL
jgi:hypothetical protein